MYIKYILYLLNLSFDQKHEKCSSGDFELG